MCALGRKLADLGRLSRSLTVTTPGAASPVGVTEGQIVSPMTQVAARRQAPVVSDPSPRTRDRYQRPDAFTVRRCVSKSTWTIPNRWP
jgi:hypothetical protein